MRALFLRWLLAGGAIPTPLFLLKQGLANRSGEVGKNLTLHPSGGFHALFPDSNVSIHVLWGVHKQNTVLAIGKSIFWRSAPDDASTSTNPL